MDQGLQVRRGSQQFFLWSICMYISMEQQGVLKQAGFRQRWVAAVLRMVGQRGASLKYGLGPLDLAERQQVKKRDIWDTDLDKCLDESKENFDSIVLTPYHGSHLWWLWKGKPYFLFLGWLSIFWKKKTKVQREDRYCSTDFEWPIYTGCGYGLMIRTSCNNFWARKDSQWLESLWFPNTKEFYAPVYKC